MFTFTACNSSKNVNNPAYGLLLKTLYKNTVPLVNVEQLSHELPADSIVLLDSREEAEYKVSHLKNSIWVGYEAFDSTKVADFPKDTTIVVYCSVGYRSERIGEQLQKMGFTNVYNLYGGIFEWANREQEVLDSTATPTKKVHGFSKSWGIWLNKKVEKIY
ncbi:MAG: rhodanese-like domain-containing protein [Chitinophagales bacterium]